MTDQRTRDELSGANRIETQPGPAKASVGARPVFPVYGPRAQSGAQPAPAPEAATDPAYVDYGIYGGRETTDDQQAAQSQAAPAAPGRSFEPTRWPIVNDLLTWTDDLTHGKAGVIQRLFTYLLIGGTAALVNLGVLAFFKHYGTIDFYSFKTLPYSIFAYAVSYEISIMANFIPNDYFTFRHMAGHDRSWRQRALRFHITSIGGIIVTTIIFFGLNAGFHLDVLIAQAIALIIAVFFNFTFHHLFTYAAQHKS